jgi:hypothetical protein
MQYVLMSQGHANFLDVLVSELDISDNEDETAPPAGQEQVQVVQNEHANNDVGHDVEDEGEQLDDEDTASDSWSECDSSDDDDHALVRTISGRPFATALEARAQGRSNSEVAAENAEDYFQFDHPAATVIAVGGVLNIGEVQHRDEDYKKDAVVSVTVASETLTPLASPTDEVELNRRG